MTENEENKTIPVTMQEVCDYMGYLVEEVEKDPVVKRNILRLINFSDIYLKGAIGKEYPVKDERT